MIVIETERLILRHFHIMDVEALSHVFGDAEVMHFGPGIQTTEWVQDWIQNCLENYYHKWGFGPWAVMEKLHREPIGYCGLFFFADVNGQPEVEIGYRLAHAYWGHGYATEAALAVRDYSFNVLGMSRLIAMIDPQNTASIRVAEKIGMRYETEVMFEGYTHPDHVYSIVNRKRG
jgi:ribosomal-protein-alanine N-acetyltransferase